MYVTGWTVALAALGALPAVWLTDRNFAWLWVLGVVALACIDALLAPSVTQVGVRRMPAGAVRLTEATSTTLEVTNQGRRSVRGAVRDAWQPSAGASVNRHRLRISPGEVVRLVTTVKPTRRGDRHAGDVTVRLEGPMRLAGRQRSIAAPAVLRVLPEFSSRKHLPARLARLREIDGLTAVQLKGAGSEFDSLREYVIGDDVRTIDWRASARRADVMVKTFRPERDRRVLVVVDTSRLSAVRVGDAPRLDASVEAALLLTALAARAGDRVQATVFDRSERARAVGLTESSAISRLADALAPIEPALVEPNWPALVRLAQERLSQRALVVLLTSVETSVIDSGLLDAVAALSSSHLVMVASVADPETQAMLTSREDVHAVYAAGAAARDALERQAIESRLRQWGAEVVIAEPDALAPAVADRYLALKASGRL